MLPYVIYFTLTEPPMVGYDSDVTLTLTAFGACLVWRKLRAALYRATLSRSVETISLAKDCKLCAC